MARLWTGLQKVPGLIPVLLCCLVRNFSMTRFISTKNAAELAQGIKNDIEDLEGHVKGVLNNPLVTVPYRYLINCTALRCK